MYTASIHNSVYRNPREYLTRRGSIVFSSGREVMEVRHR